MSENQALSSAFLSNVGNALNAFSKREYEEDFNLYEKPDYHHVSIAYTDEVPCSRYTEKELLTLSVPRDVWGKEFPLDVYLDLYSLEMIAELNGVEIERVKYMSEEALIDQLKILDFDSAVEINLTDNMVAAIFGFKCVFDDPTDPTGVKKLYDTTEIKDSLELDSGTVIAALGIGTQCVRIEVDGKVRVTYDGVTYRRPSEFPEYVKNAIRSKTIDGDESIDIGNNNWFSLLFGHLDSENEYEFDPDDKLVDVEGMTRTQLFELLHNEWKRVFSEKNDEE